MLSEYHSIAIEPVSKCQMLEKMKHAYQWIYAKSKQHRSGIGKLRMFVFSTDICLPIQHVEIIVGLLIAMRSPHKESYENV